MTIQDDPVPVQHGSLGIASFVTAMVGILLFVGTLFLSPSRPISVTYTVNGLLIAFWLEGIGLGIAGVVERTARKVFPVLGIVISAVMIILKIRL
jgi:hypothetical protein